tara:strand:- start:430 stop:1056 length:627 start_codon:yes stop_codon:yes gene_type:complete
MIGKFITFEGIDGCGKSTQARLLYEKINSSKTESLLTREPGGSEGAEEIRALLVTGDRNRWSPETEILLFTAARRDHIEKTILPAINSNKTVISDRFFDSTRVYQGAAGTYRLNLVESLHKLVVDIVPDLTFIIDMDPEVALERGLARKTGEDRFEDFGLPFQKSLRKAFVDLAAADNKRCILIDGNNSKSNIEKQIYSIYLAHFDGE